MPRIMVTTTNDEWLSGPVMLMERINLSDFDSDHFIAHLVQRLRWAVSDSHAAERQPTAQKSVSASAPAGLATALDASREQSRAESVELASGCG